MDVVNLHCGSKQNQRRLIKCIGILSRNERSSNSISLETLDYCIPTPSSLLGPSKLLGTGFRPRTILNSSLHRLVLTSKNVKGAFGYADLCIKDRSVMMTIIDQSILERHHNTNRVLSVSIRQADPQQRSSVYAYGGSVLIMLAVTCLLLMLQRAGTAYPWSKSKVWGTLVGFILLAICFAVYEVHLGEEATNPVRLLKHRTVWRFSSPQARPLSSQAFTYAPTYLRRGNQWILISNLSGRQSVFRTRSLSIIVEYYIPFSLLTPDQEHQHYPPAFHHYR